MYSQPVGIIYDVDNGGGDGGNGSGSGGCCGTMVLYPVKICHLYWLNKTLIGQ